MKKPNPKQKWIAQLASIHAIALFLSIQIGSAQVQFKDVFSP